MQDKNKIVQRDFIASHVNLKMLHDWLVIREYLLSINTCGLYRVEHFRAACEAGSINYNTARGRIGWYEQQGLLVRNKKKGVIKLVQLTGKVHRLEKLFSGARVAIKAAKNPRMYFADLHKRKLLKANVIAQANKEAEKIECRYIADKFLKSVRGSKSPIGVRQGINLALGTIGRIIGRSKATAFRTMERINDAGIMRIVKDSAIIGRAEDIGRLRLAYNLWGRVYVKDGRVMERLQNSYIF